MPQPDKCAATWLDSLNGADPDKTTSITWAEMDDNNNPMAQPAVPYVWPNTESGIYPGHSKLYGDNDSKEIDGVMDAGIEYHDHVHDDEDEDVDAPVETGDSSPPAETGEGDSGSSASVVSGSLAAAAALAIAAIVL